MAFRYSLLVFSCLLISIVSLGQAPPIAWQRCLKELCYNQANAVINTTDGGFVVAGYTTCQSQQAAFLVARFDIQRTLVWQKTFGGSQEEEAKDIIQTPDGGFLIVGGTKSTDGDVTGNHGDNDVWLVKVNSLGVVEWQKCYGGSKYDYGHSITAAANGDYVITGGTESTNGDVSGHRGNRDVLVLKVSSAGALRWQRCFGGSGSEEATSVRLTTDSGLIIAGYTNSNDQQVSGQHGNGDAWMLKLTGQGDLQWQRCLGGSGRESGIANETGLIEIAEGYVLATNTLSNDGDVTSNHGDRTLGVHGDAWVVWLDRSGTLIRQRCLGGTESDGLTSVIPTNDGSLIAAGYTNSVDGDAQRSKPANPLDSDYWCVRLSTTGDLQWQKAIGGSGLDVVHGIVQNATGDFILAGSSAGADGDVRTFECRGGVAVWIAALGRGASDLSLSAYSSTRSPALNQAVTVTVTVRNDGPERAEAVQLSSRLPARMAFAASSDFSMTPDGLFTQIDGLDKGATRQLRFTARPTVQGSFRITAQVKQASTVDLDSRPDSGTGDGEDDMTTVNLRTIELGNEVFTSPNPNQLPLPPVALNQPAPDPNKADLSLRLVPNNQSPVVNGLTSLSVVVMNEGGTATGAISVRLVLPAHVEAINNSQITTSTYVVSIPNSLAAGATATASVLIRVHRSGIYTLTAEIGNSTVTDPDSTPNNGTANGEDDTAQVTLRVH